MLRKGEVKGGGVGGRGRMREGQMGRSGFKRVATERAMAPQKTRGGRENGAIESAGINRMEVGNERVLQRRPSQSLWP